MILDSGLLFGPPCIQYIEAYKPTDFLSNYFFSHAGEILPQFWNLILSGTVFWASLYVGEKPEYRAQTIDQLIVGDGLEL